MHEDAQTHRADHIHLDVLGGIAGDMFIAAFLDARPDLAAGTLDAIRAAGLPEDWSIEPAPGTDAGLVGTRLKISTGQSSANGEGHHHTHYRDIAAALAAKPLAAPVRTRALEILRLIAQAEAEVHGIDIGNVALHEVGAWDSIADVVGAAFLIEAVLPSSWSTSPLPVGGGFIQVAHGRLPVPAPATQKLLEGFAFVDDGVSGERITPTGAAILRHLQPSLRMPGGIHEAVGTGHGFGTRKLESIANLLRLRFYRPREMAERDSQVAVIEFLVDDQTPEDLAAGLEALRDQTGVLDVLEFPAMGKKGRMGHAIQVLTTPESLDRTTRACFVETTTIGLRWRLEYRITLARRQKTDADGLAVKMVERPGGGLTAKAGLDDLRARTQGQSQRETLRRRAEGAALMEEDDDRS